jgi:hypothetical protein
LCYPYGAVAKTYRAHRIAYFLETGEDLGDHEGMHSCDNRRCCNPSHVSRGTHKENLTDMRAKGRAGDCRNFGENHGRCVLTDARVAQLKADRLHGVHSERSLAEKYGISPSQVHRILRGQSRAVPTPQREAAE